MGLSLYYVSKGNGWVGLENGRLADFQYCIYANNSKVENILKGSLDSIPSPSVKIQTMGGKVCLMGKGKTLLGIVNKLIVSKC